MGTSTLMDIIGSTFILGILILAVVAVNANVSEWTFGSTSTLNTQQNSVEVARLIEWDFLKIGYGVDAGPKIMLADSTRLTFYGDLDRNGTIDKIRYYTKEPVERVGLNPNTFILYRLLNDEPEAGANLGVTLFWMAYYDSVGNQLSTPVDPTSYIKSIQVRFMVESIIPTVAGDTTYPGAYWEKRIYPRNL
ncbi:MAG: hypothetical protein V3U68_04205 [Bacteroidota bacterium]